MRGEQETVEGQVWSCGQILFQVFCCIKTYESYITSELAFGHFLRDFNLARNSVKVFQVLKFELLYRVWPKTALGHDNEEGLFSDSWISPLFG